MKDRIEVISSYLSICSSKRIYLKKSLDNSYITLPYLNKYYKQLIYKQKDRDAVAVNQNHLIIALLAQTLLSPFLNLFMWNKSSFDWCNNDNNSTAWVCANFWVLQ